MSDTPQKTLADLACGSFSHYFLPAALSPSPSSDFLSAAVFPSVFLTAIRFSSAFASADSAPPHLCALHAAVSTYRAIPESSAALHCHSYSPESFPPAPIRYFPDKFPPMHAHCSPAHLPDSLSFLYEMPMVPPHIPMHNAPELPDFVKSAHPRWQNAYNIPHVRFPENKQWYLSPVGCDSVIGIFVTQPVGNLCRKILPDVVGSYLSFCPSGIVSIRICQPILIV